MSHSLRRLCKAQALTVAAMLAGGLLAASAPARAQETEPVAAVAPAWPACRFCPFESGASGTLESGLAYVSDSDYTFGDGSGLTDRGLYFIGNASARWRQADGSGYWDLEASDLGIDSRALRLRAGRQGRFGAELSYEALPRRISDTPRTPFQGVGGDTLSLPAGWTPGASTRDMPDLDANLGRIALRQDRERIATGFSFTPLARWDNRLRVQRDHRSGVQQTGGSFITRNSQFVAPVDSDTDQIEISSAYRGARWHALAAYYGSFFDNEHAALTWQSPYEPLVAGGEQGRLARAPDNQFHQFSLGGGYQPVRWAALSARVAGGVMLQDEPFLPATINPNLATPLPRESLDGEVSTRAARLQGAFGPWAGLRLRADWLHDARDNKTPQANYTQVVTDTFVDDARRNQPYSFSRDRYRLAADYRVRRVGRLSMGWDQDQRSRSFQARSETEESKFWTRLRVQASWPIGVTLEASRADRGGSAFLPADPGAPQNNPAMRQYHLADRRREEVASTLSVAPRDWASLDLHARYARDRFPDTRIGLQRRRGLGYGADIAVRAFDSLALSAFWARDSQRSQQAGSQAFADPDWTADNRDLAEVAGLRAEYPGLAGRWDLGASWELAHSRGETAVLAGASDPPFPDQSTRRQDARAWALWHLRPALGLRAEARYVTYRSDDWTLDAVAPDTMANVLALGQASPSYDLAIVALSVRYEFE